jgi:hypothetical protein
MIIAKLIAAAGLQTIYFPAILDICGVSKGAPTFSVK